MKKFLQKIIIYSTIYFISAFAITTVVYHYLPDNYDLVEDPYLISKLNYFTAHGNEYNTVFIGSSLTMRHINPVLFDSLTTTYGINSYNLGLPGMRPFRTYDLVNRLLNNKSVQLQYILLELNQLDLIQSNYNNKSIMYSMDHEKFLFSIRSTFDSNLAWIKKCFYLFQYLRAYLYKYSGFGLFHLLHPLPISDEVTKANVLMQEHTEGFYAKDFELRNTTNDNIKEGYLAENMELLEDTSVISKNIELQISKYGQKYLHEKQSIYLEFLGNLRSKSKKKNVEIIFVLPPRLSETATNSIYPVYKKLDINQKIDLSDPKKFPEFYTVQNSFDINHLNSKGSNFYTSYLAQQFLRIIGGKYKKASKNTIDQSITSNSVTLVKAQ